MIMLTVSIVLLIILAIGSAIYLNSKFTGREWFAIAPSMLCGIWFVMFVIMGIPMVYVDHVSEVEGVQYEQSVIDIQQNKLNSLYDRLESFQYDPASIAMWNHDTPVASTTEAIERAENNIAYAEKRVEMYKRSIRQRQHWIYSWMVDLVPLEE